LRDGFTLKRHLEVIQRYYQTLAAQLVRLGIGKKGR
jgi:hypothetical protein